MRVIQNNHRREMGLGAYPRVGLAEARKLATSWRDVAKDELRPRDPIALRRRQKAQAIKNLNIFRDVAKDAFESRKAQLKDEGRASRWFGPLDLHVLPKIGDTPVSDIDQIVIRDCLKGIWHTKAGTAEKALQRIKICIDHAAALGRDVDIQATAKARKLLGKQRHEVKHIAALDWRDVPSFYSSLSEGTVTQLAMRFLILTGSRSKPVRFAHIDQFDGDVWTIPADLMKAIKGKAKDFEIPLSPEAIAVVGLARQFNGGGFLFPNVRQGVISDATMSRYMDRVGLEARPHGFRSSLRTWLAECTDAPWEVAETCISHATGNKVSRSYERTTHLEQRRVLMNRWADHCLGQSGKVLEIATNG